MLEGMNKATLEDGAYFLRLFSDEDAQGMMNYLVKIRNEFVYSSAV